MIVALQRLIAKLAVISVVVVGMVSGCSSNTPPPAIPTSVEQIKDEAKDLGQGISQVGKDAADKLHDVLAREVPIDELAPQFLAQAASLYCASKAKSAEAAAVVRKEIEARWRELEIGHPSYHGPKLDLDGAACEK